MTSLCQALVYVVVGVDDDDPIVVVVVVEDDFNIVELLSVGEKRLLEKPL